MALVAQVALVMRITVVRAALNDRNFRQQVSQRTDRSRLPRPSMSHDQNAADQWIDDVEKQRQLHLFLANYRCEWIGSIVHRVHRLPDLTFPGESRP
jgi:hypothetical protein